MIKSMVAYFVSSADIVEEYIPTPF